MGQPTTYEAADAAAGATAAGEAMAYADESAGEEERFVRRRIRLE